MDETTKNTDDALCYHYKETVRLASICDSYAQSAFADFKMLSAVGAILSWKPIHDAFKLGGPNDNELLCYGFVAIILIVAIVGIMNLQKQLIVNFYLEQLQSFETEIRLLLGRKDSPTFRVAENWRTSAAPRQRRLGFLFYLLFYLSALLPLFMLEFNRYTVIYLVFTVLVITMHTAAMKMVHQASIKGKAEE